MPPLYRIKDWDRHFENNRTREMKTVMRWIPVPNKHDGDGYCTLVDRPDGAAMLGCWLAILQVASKCDRRGTLLRSASSPHTAGTISRIVRLPEDLLQKALDLLASDEIGWIEVVEFEASAGGCGIPAGRCHETAAIAQDGDYGMEWKGIEVPPLTPPAGGAQSKTRRRRNPDADLNRSRDTFSAERSDYEALLAEIEEAGADAAFMAWREKWKLFGTPTRAQWNRFCGQPSTAKETPHA